MRSPWVTIEDPSQHLTRMVGIQRYRQMRLQARKTGTDVNTNKQMVLQLCY
jgi:hypothetical protein